MEACSIRCQFGSGGILSIGENTAHAVVAIRGVYTNERASIALTPEGLRRLATSLTALADKLEAKAEGRS
jgi:hypothetical protein